MSRIKNDFFKANSEKILDDVIIAANSFVIGFFLIWIVGGIEIACVAFTISAITYYLALALSLKLNLTAYGEHYDE